MWIIAPWAGRLAADLARVALKAATTNGAKGKRRTRAMLTLSDCDGGVGEDHETGARTLLERVKLLLPLLVERTHAHAVRAPV